MDQRGWIYLSGALWFVIGLFLMYKGLFFISSASGHVNNWIIFFALMIGFLKGRFVLVKTVQKVVLRIRSLPSPIRFSQVYPKSYWILIGSMMMLGMALRYLPIPISVRGFVDLAIGSALMNGSMLYFRAARAKSA